LPEVLPPGSGAADSTRPDEDHSEECAKGRKFDRFFHKHPQKHAVLLCSCFILIRAMFSCQMLFVLVIFLAWRWLTSRAAASGVGEGRVAALGQGAEGA